MMRNDDVTAAMMELGTDGGPDTLISLGASGGFDFVLVTRSLTDVEWRW